MADMSPKRLAISYVRFSTPEQIKGHSLVRQTQLSTNYAEKHGLYLDERFTLRDLGLSAYHGDHKAKGALGGFLDLVNKGMVPEGSVLLVESLDRLSREGEWEAFGQFCEIVNKGIKIVTLLDEREYEKGSMGIEGMLYSIGVMSRAHEESATKAKRLLEAWDAKRNKIGSKKLTAIAPAWLQLNQNTQRFEPIPDRCDLVRRIFNLSLEGNGADKITKILNSEGKPAWRSKSGWHRSYVQKILHNRAVLGECQPHRMERRKRKAIGAPVHGYFPTIINNEDFHRVQERLRLNTGKGGKNGKIGNLFGHIAKCGYCGKPMQYVDKGGRGGVSLICDTARRGLGCVRVSFHYQEFEDAFLKCCNEIDVGGVLPDKADGVAKEITALRATIEALMGEIRGNAAHLEKLDLQLERGGSESLVEHVSQNQEKALAKRQALRAKLEAAEVKLQGLTNAERNAEVQLKNMGELMNVLRGKIGDDLVTIRQRLRMEIRKLVGRIEVFPDGLKGKSLVFEEEPIRYVNYHDCLSLDFFSTYDPDIFRTKSEWQKHLKRLNKELGRHLEQTTGRQYRLFTIFFKAGGVKEIYQDGGTYKIGLTGKDFKAVRDNVIAEIYEQASKDGVKTHSLSDALLP